MEVGGSKEQTTKQLEQFMANQSEGQRTPVMIIVYITENLVSAHDANDRFNPLSLFVSVIGVVRLR